MRLLLMMLVALPAFAEFTPVNHAAGTRDYYVSTSGINNAQCSQANPCANLGNVIKQMKGGDHLYLKRGDVWKDAYLNGLPSGAAGAPTVVSYWGDGARPVIASTGKIINYNRAPWLQHVWFIGLHFYGYKMDPDHAEFTGTDKSEVSLLGGHSDLLFEDNRFTFVEFVMQGWSGGNPTSITLRRNIFAGGYYSKSSFDRVQRPSLFFAANAQNLLIEENVFDHGGWHASVKGAGANMYNHNLYLQHDNHGNSLVVRNNIITRASSHGIHGRPGGLYEGNFFARNAVNLQMGYADHPLPEGVSGIARGNVISEGTHMIKGDAACSGNNLCTPAVWGLVLAEKGKGRFIVEDNIVSQTYLPAQNKFDSLKRAGLGIELADVNKGNIGYRFSYNDEGGTGKYMDPGRTVSTYAASIGLEPGFDSFMKQVLNRPVGEWPKELTAQAINEYFRAGFAPPGTSPAPEEFQFVLPKSDIDSGQNLVVEVAPVSGVTADVADVDLYINGQIFRTEKEPPYRWGALEIDDNTALRPARGGVYELLALVTFPDGQTQKLSRRVVVRAEASPVPTPVAETVRLVCTIQAGRWSCISE